jgi:ATP-dependent DNA helicase RecQ
MFDLADSGTCLWHRLAGHFAEVITACGESCGNCLKSEIPTGARPVDAPPAQRGLRQQRPALDGSSRSRDFDAGPYEPQGATPERGEPMPDRALFERLRALRKKLADEREVPAFVVFSDRTLQDMAARRPRTRSELLDLYGVGQKKLEEYGDFFLAEILREP